MARIPMPLLFLAYAAMFVAPLQGGPGACAQSQPVEAARSPIHGNPNAAFVLRTGIAGGKMVFIGQGGAIDGRANPTLTVHEGDLVQITLINGEGAEHDIVIPDFRAASQRVSGVGASSAIAFRVGSPGTFFYYCSVPGHRQAGMQGKLKVELAPPKPEEHVASIARDPADLPPPVGDRAPMTLRYDLETVERVGRLDDHSTYDFWTFDGKVPGPFLRVRVGDTIELHLKNAKDSLMIHSIDLHAVNGPGGGAEFTQVEPGEEKSFVFKALTAGLFIYHCATPMVANHISNGMYGLILVEPPGGLPKADREFYVVQGEIYTNKDFGSPGLQEFSAEKLLEEKPDYFTFNGDVGALTTEHPLMAKTGETIRIFFGVAGPNLPSSFHIIGQIFDKVYEGGRLDAPPASGAQTVMTPPGSAAIIELKAKTPGAFTLVDHAMSRMEHGLLGTLEIGGAPQPDIVRSGAER